MLTRLTTTIFIPLIIVNIDVTGQINGGGNSCSFSQYVEPGRVYRINSPLFPQRYPAGIFCQWHLYSPPNYDVKLSCFNVQLPMAFNGCADFLTVSVTGNPNDGQKFCSAFTYESAEMLLSLFSYRRFSSWAGGIFSCNVEAVKNNLPDHTNNCACGWSYGTRIVGGNDAQPNEFPSMAAVVDAKTHSIICGATIITNRALLTAAHCFHDNTLPGNYGLFVGDHDLTTAEESNATAYHMVAAIMKHDDWLSTGGGNDIAIIITARTIKFNSQVGPACLPFSTDKEDLMRKYVIAAGWGTTFFGGPKSQILQKVVLQVVPDSECKKYEERFKPDRHICTYAPGKDACQFDSGGPLYYYYPPNNVYTLVGIINAGYGCATEIPSLSINVHHYVSWILQYIPSDTICRKS